MKFPKCLSNTILRKAKKEDNKLRKLLRQINYISGFSLSECLPLFEHLEADFDRISDFNDI